MRLSRPLIKGRGPEGGVAMGPRQGYGGRVIRSVARFAWTMAAQRQRHLHGATENTTPFSSQLRNGNGCSLCMAWVCCRLRIESCKFTKFFLVYRGAQQDAAR